MGLGAAGGGSHSVELLLVVACRGTALPEPRSFKAILNDISNPAAQPGNCLLPSATTNPFTQEYSPVLGRDGLSASGAGKVSGPLRVKITSEFECGFAQALRPSKVLPQRRADCHVSKRVDDVNDVVVSRYPQRVRFKPIFPIRGEPQNLGKIA